jgi:hypothetical protein
MVKKKKSESYWGGHAVTEPGSIKETLKPVQSYQELVSKNKTVDRAGSILTGALHGFLKMLHLSLIYKKGTSAFIKKPYKVEMNMERSQILAIFEEKMVQLKKILENITNSRSYNYKIYSGVSFNDSGFCVAYISCVKQTEEETIDLTLDISFDENLITISKGIYLSNGNLIKDFETVVLDLVRSEHISNDLDKFFNQLIENELKDYTDYIFSQRDRQI